MPNTEPVRVTIFNHTYALVASEDPHRIEQLAHRIDDLMSTIAARGGNVDATRAAVLACLRNGRALENPLLLPQGAKRSYVRDRKCHTVL
jgi:hypothetical protein